MRIFVWPDESRVGEKPFFGISSKGGQRDTERKRKTIVKGAQPSIPPLWTSSTAPNHGVGVGDRGGGTKLSLPLVLLEEEEDRIIVRSETK